MSDEIMPVDGAESVATAPETSIETPASDNAVETPTDLPPSSDDDGGESVQGFTDSPSEDEPPTEEVPQDENPTEPPEPERDFAAELQELEDRHQQELGDVRQEHGEQVSALEEQNAALKAALLDITLKSAATEKDLSLNDNRLKWVDRSLLVTDQGMPDLQAVSALVMALGEPKSRFSQGLGIGPQGDGSSAPDPLDGFARNGSKLNNRNRNPFRRK